MTISFTPFSGAAANGRVPTTATNPARTLPLMNKFAVRALLTLSASAGFLAAADTNLITLGNAQSPVITGLKSQRNTVDGRALIESVKQSPELSSAGPKAHEVQLRLMRGRLGKADAVVADLSEITPTEDDSALMEAAREAGVPVVLENVTREKMANVFGVGLDNPLVIAEYDAARHMGHLTFGEPAHLEGVEDDSATMADLRSFNHKLHVAESVLTNSSQARAAAKAPGAPKAELTNPTGYCSQAVLTSSQCQEWYSTGLGPITFNIATLAGGANYLHPYFPAMSFVDPEFFAGVYQVGLTKYVRVQALGGWGNRQIGALPPSFPENFESERMPFFSNYAISLQPVGLNTQTWGIDRVAPLNPNNNTTIATTTGWQVGASGGNSGGSLTASYGSSTTSTVTLNDWSIIDFSSSPTAGWAYYMSAASDCEGDANAISYGSLTDSGMTSYCTKEFKQIVNNPPDWSWFGYNYTGTSNPLAESVWHGNTSETFQILNQVIATVNDFSVNNHFVYYDWSELATAATSSNYIAINTSVVHN
jgi:hypothetical protein